MASRRMPLIATIRFSSLLPASPGARRFATFFLESQRRPRHHPTQWKTTPRSLPSLSRLAHTIPRPSSSSKPVPKDEDAKEENSTLAKNQAPHYQLTFTCIPCGERSSHNVSKQGYHHGSVLISCPGCRNRHVISDHLRIFGDKNITVEDLMRERGRLVKKGTLGEDGDLEFWEDGTVTPHEAARVENNPSDPRHQEEELPAAPGASFGTSKN